MYGKNIAFTILMSVNHQNNTANQILKPVKRSSPILFTASSARNPVKPVARSVKKLRDRESDMISPL